MKTVSDLKIGKYNFKQINISSENSSLSSSVRKLFDEGETKLVFKIDTLLGTSMFHLFREAANRAGNVFIIATNESAREMLILFGIHRIIKIFENEKQLEVYCQKIKKLKQNKRK